MALRLSEEAEEDILSIFLEGCRLFGDAQAERYHREIEQVFDLIARNPMLARVRNEIRPPVRVHPHEARLIIYLVLVDPQGDVLVVRVRHAHEDWQSEPT